MSRAAQRFLDRTIDLGGERCGHGIRGLPTGEVLVATFGARCAVVDPDSGEATLQPLLGPDFLGRMGAHIIELAASKTHPVVCSAATMTIETKLWSPGSTRVDTICPEGPITSVSLTDDGSLLAVGCGKYPLGSDRFAASVELFSTGAPTEPVARRVLPGTAVDRFAFDRLGGRLFAATGHDDQHRGFLTTVEVPSLAIHELTETPDAWCRGCFVRKDRDSLLLVFRGSVQVRSLSRLSDVRRSVKLKFDSNRQVAYDAQHDQLVFSTGEVLDGELRERACVLPPPQCIGVAVLCCGRLAMLGERNLLRVWDNEWRAGESSNAGG